VYKKEKMIYFPTLAQNGLSTAIAALLKTPNADL
jgi:hypothetical protein